MDFYPEKKVCLSGLGMKTIYVFGKRIIRQVFFEEGKR